MLIYNELETIKFGKEVLNFKQFLCPSSFHQKALLIPGVSRYRITFSRLRIPTWVGVDIPVNNTQEVNQSPLFCLGRLIPT